MVWLLAWPLASALIFGVLIAATDQVAVIAMLKDTGIGGRLRLLVESENLFNDGVAAVLFGLAMSWAEASSGSALDAGWVVVRYRGRHRHWIGGGRDRPSSWGVRASISSKPPSPPSSLTAHSCWRIFSRCLACWLPSAPGCWWGAWVCAERRDSGLSGQGRVFVLKLGFRGLPGEFAGVSTDRTSVARMSVRGWGLARWPSPSLLVLLGRAVTVYPIKPRRSAVRDGP